MLSITTTHTPATDLGYLLHKNPSRVHEVEVTSGKAIVAYPEASTERCTVAVILQIDTVELVRGKGEGSGSLAQYVNDRPYVASSFLSVALGRVFGTAMSGKCKDRPELATTKIPLEVVLPVVPCRAGEEVVRSLFEPLGYEVTVKRHALDDQFPEWGESAYYRLELRGDQTVRDMLNHLFVLLPVLDARKHYYMEAQEVDKLLRKGEGWLAEHPQRNWIVRSYLGRRPSLMREALEQLANIEPELEAQEASVDEVFSTPELKEKKKSLHETRHDRVVEVVRELQPKSVVDLGCGEGRLIRKLIPIKGLDKIVGMDLSYYDLEKAHRRLRLEEATPRMRERVQLIHGSLMYRDPRLEGFDVATVVEVIEHLDLPRLQAFERVIFEAARPRTLVVTTPNREYNPVYEQLEGFRHEDHRFEWTRAEFEDWCNQIADRFNYKFKTEGVGEEHPDYGHPSQMAVFTR